MFINGPELNEWNIRKGWVHYDNKDESCVCHSEITTIDGYVYLFCGSTVISFCFIINSLKIYCKSETGSSLPWDWLFKFNVSLIPIGLIQFSLWFETENVKILLILWLGLAWLDFLRELTFFLIIPVISPVQWYVLPYLILALKTLQVNTLEAKERYSGVDMQEPELA